MAAPAKLAIDIVVNSRDAQKGLADTGRDVEGLEKTTKASAHGMSTAFGSFAGNLAASGFHDALTLALDVLKGSIKAASDLNETTSQTGQIFGTAAGQIEQFASTSAKKLGLSKNAAMGAANTFAIFGKGAGLTGDQLGDFSTGLTGLAADLASFKNTTPEQAIEAIGSALRGESEPIRNYGVLLDEATLKNRALAMGLIDSTKTALTPQQKVLAAHAEILAQTADAQGDFAKTSEGLANQQRIAAAQWEDIQAKLGTALLPLLTKLAAFLTDTLIPAVDQFFSDDGGWTTTSEIITLSFEIIAEACRIVAVAFTWLWENVLRPFVDWIVTNWPTIAASNAVVFKVIRGHVQTAIDVFVWLWDHVLRPFVDFVVAQFPAIAGVVSTVFAFTVAAAQTGIDVFVWLWDHVLRPFVDFVVAQFPRIAAVASTAFGVIVGAVQLGIDIIGAIIDRFNGLVDFVTHLPERISSAARGMWDGISAAFRAAVNFIIRAWNSLKFEIPGFDLGPVHFGGFTLALPKIPELAAGGFVTRPTLAVVGEAGPEIVAPTAMLARLIADNTGTGGWVDARTFNVTVTSTGLGTDSPRLQRDLVDALRRYETREGPIRSGR